MRVTILSLIGAISMLFYADIAYAEQGGDHPFVFRPGSDVLYDRYGDNMKQLAVVRELVSHYEDVILTGNGHIRLVAPIGLNGGEDPIAMNLAAIRAAVVRNLLKQHFRMLTNWNFVFYFDNTRNYNDAIEVRYIPSALPVGVSPSIYYSAEKSNLPRVRQMMAKYDRRPYLADAMLAQGDTTARARFDQINALATNPVDAKPREDGPNPEKLLIAIHYRWDKDNLDSLYLSNPENLHRLDSILHSDYSSFIDTLTIVAYASPEGRPDYNKRLSERRAQTIKDYIVANYEAIAPERIVTQARGANWEGLRNFALNDSQLPLRDTVLRIIDAPLTGPQKQTLLTKLNDGELYYRYILPNYYRYLRNGASVLVTYSPNLPEAPPLVVVPEPEPIAPPIALPEPEPEPAPMPERVVNYPVAFKTNLLFDAIGASNIGVEVPIGKRFSVVGDFTYAYWRSSKNLYALQTLQGGIEGRYWFGVSNKKKLKNPEWAKPLRGWNVGVYAMLCSRYDVQWIDGYQGDGFWSAGLTAGYATPVSRNLTLEFSLAAGYFYTHEYRHYHQPEFDASGKHHLMWQQTGSFGTFTLTKVRLNLVWTIQSNKKGGRR